MKFPIQKDKRFRKGIPWTSCEPFLENSRAVLIHRIKHVTTHKIGDRWKSHISVKCWCGNSMAGTKKFTFLSFPPENKLVCARCEVKAISEGMPSSDELVGKHVHKGGVIAVMKCCALEGGAE